MNKTELAERIASLPPEKRAALLAKLQQQEGRQGRREAEPIPVVERGAEHYDVSFAQQRLWFLNQFDSESAEYDIPLGYRLEGALDPALLRRALLELVVRHESLRTTFLAIDGDARQVIHERLDVPLPVVDLRDRPEERREADARYEMSVDAKKPFDLEKGPLLRGVLFRLGDEEHLLYLNVHHIVFDGWSNGVMMRELMAIYEALVAGEDPQKALDPMPIQYLDFALWQRDWLSGDNLKAQVDYWRDRIDGVPPLELATDRPRPAVRTAKGTTTSVEVGEELTRALGELSAKENCTLFVTLLAAFRTLLYRYTHQDDFAVGTLIANRTRPELEGLIGFFANTLVLRTPFSDDITFRELMAREKANAYEAYDHQDVPFEKVVEELNPPRDMSRTPYFQVMFILQNAPSERKGTGAGAGDAEGGVRVGTLGVDSETSKFEMTLYLTQGENVRGFLEYNTDLFDRDTVVRMMGHFRLLLEGIVENPDQRLFEYPLMGEDERKLVVEEWNQTDADYPRDATVPSLFETRVDQHPDRVALVARDGTPETLTYAELDARANRLAHRLIALGTRPEQFVGVCTDRSAHMVVALLATMKAGCAYLPMDPGYPSDRLAFMLEDTGAPVILTLSSLEESLPTSDATKILLDKEDLSGEPATRPAPRSGPENLAYVIHTSGSTGKPKGVPIPHRAVVNFLTTMAERPGLDEKDTLLAVTTISFDIAGLELYLPLAVGAKLVVASRDDASAGERLSALIDEAGTTVMQATPATWQLLYGAGWKGVPHLKVLCGGEALPPDLAERLLRNCRQVWNVYGPTEATIWSTVRRVDADDLGGGAVSIGQPIANTDIYLVDRHYRPVPIGVPGELLIGGDGLARGYLNRPELAAERFIASPFAPQNAPERLYRTGDLARFDPEGNLHFLGRIDHQVKVRGYRIELGEIESVLDHHPAIDRAVVITREDTPGTVRLVAYLMGHPGEDAPELPKPGELRDFLKSKLPAYMVPAIFVPMETLPLTPNGKVNRRALPKPDPTLFRTTEYVAPRDEKEEAFAKIWAEVLDVEKVGVEDDFFELGGDSLLVIRVVTKAAKQSLVITTKQLFQNKTIAELAKVEGTTTILAEQDPVVGEVPMGPAQAHFLSLHHTIPEYHAIGAFLRPKGGRFDLDALRGALRVVLDHHDSLRMRLLVEDGPARLVSDPLYDELPFEILDLREIGDDDAVQERFLEHAKPWALGTRFDDGPMTRACLYHRPDEDVVFLVGHFMTADIGSWQIILDDLDTAYRQLSRGESLEMQPKTTSFRQWIERLTERVHGEGEHEGMAEEEREYWLTEKRKDSAPMPIDMPEGVNTMRSSKSIWMEFEEEETRKILREVTRATGTQIDAVILTSVLYAFEHWTGSRSLLIDLLGHGREALYDDIDLTRTVAWLNTIYPAYLDLGDAPDPITALKSVNKQLRDIPHGGIGYGLLRYLNRDPEVARRLDDLPEANVFFNYFGDDRRSELTVLEKTEDFGGWGFDLETRRLRPIGVFVYIRENRMRVRWEYSTNLHRDETMEEIAQVLRGTLEHLLAHY